MSAVVLQTTAGPLDVLGGSLTMPGVGNWVAHLELGETTTPAGAVTILFAREADAPVTFSGTVDHGDTWQGRQKLVVFGGAGGLLTPLPFREYLAGAAPVPAAQLLTDVLAVAGEQLDPATGTTGLTGLGVPRWTRAAGLEGSRALGRIARRWGLGWRVLDSGAIWMGADTYPTVPDALVTFLEDRDGDAIIDWAAPNAAVLRPRTTVLGKRIERVTYTVGDSGAPRVQLLYRSDVDDFAGAVRRVSVTDPYALLYGATVKAQNADGSLELAVDSPAFPELRRVLYRSFSGAHEVVGAGDSVIVAFLGGRDDGAFAWGCAQNPAATLGAARMSDAVDVGAIGVTAPPGGGPCTILVTPPGTTTPPGSSALAGRISGASSRVRIA
jgi:hypothetical protein